MHVYRGQNRPRTMTLLNLSRLTLQSCSFKTEKDRRQNATFGNTHLLLIRLKQSGPSSHLEQSMGQKPINEGRQMASKIKVVKIRQYTVFPRGCRKRFSNQRKWQEHVLLGQKHYECNYQNEPDDLQCYGFS